MKLIDFVFLADTLAMTSKARKQSLAQKKPKIASNGHHANEPSILDDPDAAILTSDDCPTYRSNNNGQSQTAPVAGKFARIRYGDNQELLFNTNCQVSLTFGRQRDQSQLLLMLVSVRFA